MHLALFTDTLGDINGVSRFVQDMAREAERRRLELRVIASTRFRVPVRDNLLNFPPRFASAMPGYPQLELTLPPSAAIHRSLRERAPDMVHVSTPGPVGFLGRRYAIRRRIPLIGTYHTDFPAYIDRLFEDHVLTRASIAAMRWFYRPFRRLLVRSEASACAVGALGVPRERVIQLRPGIETARFGPSHRDPDVWRRIASESPALRALGEPGVTVLYVGRVSVEKNLPLLVEAWKRLRARADPRAAMARLVVVGDGPYLDRMRRELSTDNQRTGEAAPLPAFFLGFRHGEELAAIYASSDLFVFPSATDTLGQVVMEAQCSGLPVLVSDLGGPREVVRPGETGLVLPARDADRWADAIVLLVADRAERERISRSAFSFMARHDFARSFEHFWSAHVDALPGPSGRGVLCL